VTAASAAAAAAAATEAEYVSRLRQLPFPLLVDLLMECMQNLPDTFPARLWDAQPSTTAGGAGSGAGAASAGASADAGAVAAADVEGGDDDGSERPRKKARGDLPPAPRVVAVTAPDDDDEAPALTSKHKKPYKLGAVPLSDDGRRAMSLSAFRRVLALEGKVTEEGSESARELLIARLAAMLASDAVIDEVVAHVIREPKDRTNLALLWLYHQYQPVIMGGSDAEVAQCREWYVW
jgi:hypothetical protein